jgi:hypothetical protein
VEEATGRDRGWRKERKIEKRQGKEKTRGERMPG